MGYMFETEHLKIRKFTLEDTQSLYANHLEEEVKTWIPTGFCYQKLILDDETAPVLIYHGLNGVYISEYEKWIRLDARGNKEGVNARFH